MTDSERNVRIQELLLEFFQDNYKVRDWLFHPNLNFGGSSPATLMKMGKSDKVLLFIESALEENKRET